MGMKVTIQGKLQFILVLQIIQQGFRNSQDTKLRRVIGGVGFWWQSVRFRLLFGGANRLRLLDGFLLAFGFRLL